MKRILVSGATGQIGSALVPALRKRYGPENVIALGHKKKASQAFQSSGPYECIDIRDKTDLLRIIDQYGIDTIYHLAALLSATAESDPQLAWDININGLLAVLECAGNRGCAVFHPSSIGAFGPETPHENTPQVTIQRPVTIYGISKVSAELLCNYYHTKIGIDTRGVRYPGLISYETLPGGGTTDYAVEIYYDAIRRKKHTCFLRPDTRLDMMYMPDAVRAAIDLMEADPEKLRHRNAYNITAMSFTPDDLYRAIKSHIPDFTIEYAVDPVRQAIADSWPSKMDDSAARSEWNWNPEFDLTSMTSDMLVRLSNK